MSIIITIIYPIQPWITKLARIHLNKANAFRFCVPTFDLQLIARSTGNDRIAQTADFLFSHTQFHLCGRPPLHLLSLSLSLSRSIEKIA